MLPLLKKTETENGHQRFVALKRVDYDNYESFATRLTNGGKVDGKLVKGGFRWELCESISY